MSWFFYQKVPKGSSLGTSWVDPIGGLKAFLWHLSVLHLLVSGTTWRGEGSAVGQRLQNTLSEWTDEHNFCLLHTNATGGYSQNWGFSKTCKDVMLRWLSFVNAVNAIHASQLTFDSTETSFSVQNHCDSGAEPKGKVLDLPVNLRSSPHLWSWALGSDWKNEVTDTSCRNEFLHTVAVLSLRNRVMSSNIQRKRSQQSGSGF